MRISQLAERTDVPVATIKFYLRERLLHEGELTSPTQAQYDEGHLRRLQLIRALLGPGGLSVATVREVLNHLDHPPESRHDLLGIAHHAVHRPVADGLDLDPVHDLIARWGWQIDHKDRDTLAALADALRGLETAGFTLSEARLDRYAELMAEVAKIELADLPTESLEAAVRYVVLGTVLVEPVLLALRRLAQQDASARRFGAPPRTAD